MRRLTCCEVNGTRCFGADQHAYVCQLRFDECYLLGSMGLLHRPVQDNLNMQNLAMYQCYSIQYSVLLSALPFQHALNDQISCSLSQNTFLQWQLVFLASAKEGAITLTFGRRISLNHWSSESSVSSPPFSHSTCQHCHGHPRSRQMCRLNGLSKFMSSRLQVESKDWLGSWVLWQKSCSNQRQSDTSHRKCTCYIVMHHPSLPLSGSCTGFAISASKTASKQSSFERNSSEGRSHLRSFSFKNGNTLSAWGGRKWAKACKASSLTSSRTAILPTRRCRTNFNSSKHMAPLNLPSLEGDLTFCNAMQACKRSALSPLLRCSSMSLANKCLKDFEADSKAKWALIVTRTRA